MQVKIIFFFNDWKKSTISVKVTKKDCPSLNKCICTCSYVHVQVYLIHEKKFCKRIFVEKFEESCPNPHRNAHDYTFTDSYKQKNWSVSEYIQSCRYVHMHLLMNKYSLVHLVGLPLIASLCPWYAASNRWSAVFSN